MPLCTSSKQANLSRTTMNSGRDFLAHLDACQRAIGPASRSTALSLQIRISPVVEAIKQAHHPQLNRSPTQPCILDNFSTNIHQYVTVFCMTSSRHSQVVCPMGQATICARPAHALSSGWACLLRCGGHGWTEGAGKHLYAPEQSEASHAYNR